MKILPQLIAVLISLLSVKNPGLQRADLPIEGQGLTTFVFCADGQ